jgi:hypothetical protein
MPDKSANARRDAPLYQLETDAAKQTIFRNPAPIIPYLDHCTYPKWSIGKKGGKLFDLRRMADASHRRHAPFSRGERPRVRSLKVFEIGDFVADLGATPSNHTLYSSTQTQVCPSARCTWCRPLGERVNEGRLTLRLTKGPEFT